MATTQREKNPSRRPRNPLSPGELLVFRVFAIELVVLNLVGGLCKLFGTGPYKDLPWTAPVFYFMCAIPGAIVIWRNTGQERYSPQAERMGWGVWLFLWSIVFLLGYGGFCYLNDLVRVWND